MYIQFGQRMFGKCDVVPELFYVATYAFHINFVPFVPLGTHLILGQSGETYHSVRIPFSFKSLLYAWARLAFFLAAVVFWIVGAVTINEPPHRREASAIAIFAPAILFSLLYLFVMIYPRRVKPSYARACRLAQLAQLNDRGWAALNILYGHDITDRPMS